MKTRQTDNYRMRDERNMEAKQRNALAVGERGQSTGSCSSYRILFSNRRSDCGWMASLEGQVEWETGESRWVGESGTGNTVTFPVEIMF